MAIEPIESTNTPNEGRVIINDNFVDLDGRINEIDPDGLAWHFGTGAPLDTLGFDGDMYFDTDTQTYYGPKVDGAWPLSGVTVSIPDASETVKGKAEIATQTETDTGTDDTRIVTPLKLANYTGLGGSFSGDAGDVPFTPAGTIAATDVQAAIEEVASEAGGSVSSASETVAGIAEIATQTETNTGTDDVRIVSPLKAATRYLAKAGGTLTGFLTLNADPTSALHAVTKQYADGLTVGGAPSASETVAGIAEIATQTETNTGTDDARIVTPLKLAGRTALDTRAGVVELATDAETQTGTDTARAVTPANLTARSATETRSGIAEIATQTETDTGTDDARLVTPLKAATRFLAKAGGTLTGFLTLNADPTSALHAVTKQYADALVVGGASPASETTAGIAEIATQTETNTGTDDARMVTPLKLANYSGLGGGSSRHLVTLGSDVVNATTSYADVTGLSFSVSSGVTYRFEIIIIFDVAATGNGTRWSMNGPAKTFGAWTVNWMNSATSNQLRNADTYDDSGISTAASPFAASNLALINGAIRPSASGTIIVRFSSEAALANGVTAKAGSTLEWW